MRIFFKAAIKEGMLKKLWKYGFIKARVAMRGWFLPKPKSDKIAICALFQNDADFLKEWLDFHFSIGVDHVIMYDNKSEDNFETVLQPYVKAGLVTVRKAFYKPYFMDIVVACYNDSLKRDGAKYKWMAFLDSDEFIIPKEKSSLKELMKDYEKFPAVFVSWLIFGTSGVKSLKSDEHMIEKMVHRCPDEHDEHTTGKSIMKPSSGMLFFGGNVHYPEYAPWQQIVYADKTEFKPERTNRKVCTEGIQLNHYWYRTEDFYQKVKIPRRIAFEGRRREHKLEEWHKKRANSTYDGSALPFVKNLKNWNGNL